MASSLSEDCDLQNLSENDFTSCVFKSATRNGHPTIQIVLLEWLICPDDDIAQFEQARYVYLGLIHLAEVSFGRKLKSSSFSRKQRSGLLLPPL